MVRISALDNRAVAFKLAVAGDGAHLIFDESDELQRRDFDQQIDIVALALDKCIVQIGNGELKRPDRAAFRSDIIKDRAQDFLEGKSGQTMRAVWRKEEGEEVGMAKFRTHAAHRFKEIKAAKLSVEMMKFAIID